MAQPSAEELAAGIQGGDRRALARAITLVESSLPSDRQLSEQLLAKLEANGSGGKALRLGVTGAPGVGKSTFIDVFGMSLIDRGQTVAVLSIDPSSLRTGGSILGDKTRMPRLANQDRAFVRPSPAGGASGGVARSTPDAVSLCEAAGYDVVIVETVGVGQTEVGVRHLVDFVLLLVIPGAGDELQAIKRGILEIVDFVLVNKADGDLAELAAKAQGEYTAALGLFRGHDAPEVLTMSALERRGIDAVRESIERRRAALADSVKLRAARETALFWSLLETAVLDWLFAKPEISKQRDAILRRIAAGELSAQRATRILISELNAPSRR
jgi:LAO/AO transport system kinase